MSNTNWKSRLTDEQYWVRFPFMLLFLLIWHLSVSLLCLLILAQLVLRLFLGRPQQHLQQFSSQLTRYNFQLLRYLGFHSRQKPFPFTEWPASEAVDADPEQAEHPDDLAR